MSANQPVTSDSEHATAKPQRLLACLLCQQRKVKCDRKFPCAHCRRAHAQCVPAGQVPRQRRRRFPERELLDRIRRYEVLLQQHGVQFEPLHPSAASSANPSPANTDSPDGTRSPRRSSENKAAKPRTANVWHALSQKNLDAEDDDDGDSEDGESDNCLLLHDGELGHAVIRKAWDSRCPRDGDHHLLFGSPLSSKANLTALHPDQASIFRLWQTYLDNVDPLLKVTHTPSVQARIIDALSDLTAISAPLEALLFSIYCVAIMSLSDDRCLAVFGSSKKDLLAGYQFACRQALVNSGFLQSGDHDCLTALYLYLVSARAEADPRSLSSMLAVAVRIAQRMGYHSQFANAKHPALKAELRRRLWWSLVIFDNRVCEVIRHHTATLVPTWDCNTPSNLNDLELLPGAKALPPACDRPTEAVFVVVRSQLGDFVRHCDFHLNFIDPFLTTFAQAKDTTHGAGSPRSQELLELEKAIEEKILAFCDPENPLHFMTIWTARVYLAKNLLLEHCSRRTSRQERDEESHDPSVLYALRMIEGDTKLTGSPLTRGYLWHVYGHFPTPAYLFILQHLKKRPAGEDVDRAWEAMSNNYEARGMYDHKDYEPFFVLFSRLVMQAWEAREAMLNQHDTPLRTPRMVADIKNKIRRMKYTSGLQSDAEQLGCDAAAIRVDVPPGMAPSNGSGDTSAAQLSLAAPSPPYYQNIAENGLMDVGFMDQIWPTTNWRFSGNPLW